ncbi:uncharacterized protein LODBEIA_P19010 [Lodderomyces beijingensis]|uniref:Uncharacterized protein n=1 Tax=Lodderomyces beijingensis TaxID=1775926 RepID=A0ABP0ZHN1_9ASCO
MSDASESDYVEIADADAEIEYSKRYLMGFNSHGSGPPLRFHEPNPEVHEMCGKRRLFNVAINPDPESAQFQKDITTVTNWTSRFYVEPMEGDPFEKEIAQLGGSAAKRGRGRGRKQLFAVYREDPIIVNPKSFVSKLGFLHYNLHREPHRRGKHCYKNKIRSFYYSSDLSAKELAHQQNNLCSFQAEYSHVNGEDDKDEDQPSIVENLKVPVKEWKGTSTRGIFDSQCMVLTSRGFKQLNELVDVDDLQMAAFHKQSQTIKYISPLCINIVNSRRHQLTRIHNLWFGVEQPVLTFNHHSKHFERTTLEADSSYRLLNHAFNGLADATIDRSEITRLKHQLDLHSEQSWFSFLGLVAFFLVGNGCLTYDHHRCRYIRFQQHKSVDAVYLTKIFQDLNLTVDDDYTVCQRTKYSPNLVPYTLCTILVTNQRLLSYFHDTFGSHYSSSPTYNVAHWMSKPLQKCGFIYRLTQRELHHFIEGLMLSNGSIGPDPCVRTSFKETSLAYYSIITLAGCIPRIKRYPSAGLQHHKPEKATPQRSVSIKRESAQTQQRKQHRQQAKQLQRKQDRFHVFALNPKEDRSRETPLQIGNRGSNKRMAKKSVKQGKLYDIKLPTGYHLIVGASFGGNALSWPVIV